MGIYVCSWGIYAMDQRRRGKREEIIGGRNERESSRHGEFMCAKSTAGGKHRHLIAELVISGNPNLVCDWCSPHPPLRPIGCQDGNTAESGCRSGCAESCDLDPFQGSKVPIPASMDRYRSLVLRMYLSVDFFNLCLGQGRGKVQ